jgi:hypothetical protein
MRTASRNKKCGRGRVEEHMFDVARLLEMLEALGEAFNVVY